MRSERLEVNPYNPCVENKVIGGKQMTVYWHMDYLKESQVDPQEVASFMEWL